MIGYLDYLETLSRLYEPSIGSSTVISASVVNPVLYKQVQFFFIILIVLKYKMGTSNEY